jgi:peptidoglycan/LPS O-acetylase OafA/YrhL
MVLDVFRGVFASLIFCFHLHFYAGPPILNNGFIANSDLFVDFFFVLSGFVISYNYQSISISRELFLFYKKRFSRLYPLHLLMLFVFAGIVLLKHLIAGHFPEKLPNDPNNNILTFISNLFLLNSVKMPYASNGATNPGWNQASWSISAEMIAYLLFGAIMLYITHRSLLKYRMWFYLVTAILALTILSYATGGFSMMYTYDYGFLRGISGFFIGAFCFTIFDHSYLYFLKIRPFFFTLAETVLILLMLWMVSLGGVLKRFGLAYEILFFLCIFIFSFEKGALSALLKKPLFLRRMGAYSYSIYMIHVPFITLFDILFMRLLKMPLPAYNYLFILEYFVIYIVSGFTYRYVEMKFYFKDRSSSGSRSKRLP